MSSNLNSEPTAIGPCERVAVIGTSCSGKTTFARRLSRAMRVKHIELDAIYWRPNWTPAPKDEFRARVQDAVSSDTWVLDGNYSVARDVVWARATTLVWLNYSLPVVFSRALRRTIQRVCCREILWSGNRETFRLAFSRESILRWVLSTYHRQRREYPRLFQEPRNSHLRVIVLPSPRRAAWFIARSAPPSASE